MYAHKSAYSDRDGLLKCLSKVITFFKALFKNIHIRVRNKKASSAN